MSLNQKTPNKEQQLLVIIIVENDVDWRCTSVTTQNSELWNVTKIHKILKTFFPIDYNLHLEYKGEINSFR
jgi:hypothetical protein